jgi:hypothetical protein
VKFLRGSFFLALVFAISGCSSTVRFLIVNKGKVAVLITIDIPRPNSGSVIFSPFGFTFYPFKNGTLDYENRGPFTPKTTGDVHEVSIPAHTVLEIGHIMNQKYENSRQAFNNGREFNLKKLRVAKIEIDRENFDNYFKKTEYGVVWELP